MCTHSVLIILSAKFLLNISNWSCRVKRLHLPETISFNSETVSVKMVASSGNTKKQISVFKFRLVALEIFTLILSKKSI